MGCQASGYADKPADPTRLYHEAAKLYSDAARPVIASLRPIDLVPEFKATEIVSRVVICRQHIHQTIQTAAQIDQPIARLRRVRLIGQAVVASTAGREHFCSEPAAA